MTSAFILSVPGEEPLHFDNIDDLAQSTDAMVASILAAGLQSAADQSWNLDKKEALLMLEDERQNERKQVWVVLNGGEGRLGLNSLQKKLTWEVGDESPGGFWDGFVKVT